MNKILFWKNFKLGKELDIAGRFIYNGLRYLHEMETLDYEAEIFEVLYNLSVGLERLLKITVILIEHDTVVDQKKFERSLITHNHPELLRRVRQKHNLVLAAPHNAFLKMLCEFYKTHRYGRYGIGAMKTQGEDKTAFHAYIEKRLNIKISDGSSFSAAANSPQIRMCLGKTVGKITSILYEIIQLEAARLNIYTYEVRNDSKAEKIFLRKEYDFTQEDVLWKELLVYFVNSGETSGYFGFIKSLQPLAFDSGLAGDYLQCLGSDEKKLENMDELECLYEGLDNPGKRLQDISLIGDPSMYFDSNDEDDEDV